MINVNNNTDNPLCVFCGTNCNRMCRSYRTVKVIVSELRESIDQMKIELKNSIELHDSNVHSHFTDLSNHLNIVFNDQNTILRHILSEIKDSLLDKIAKLVDLLSKLVAFIII